ncbi:hypothetical protein G7046_g2682 [Stylonectria norvegica]|nr:hypothetical protein G7046_g2682 [Stylonectria norvegica]
MSLIPYQPHEGREIVLYVIFKSPILRMLYTIPTNVQLPNLLFARYNNAIVVRDSTSHRLEIRGLSECPTCHQPLTRPSSSEQTFDPSFGPRRETYVDPDYFRMLRAANTDAIPDRAPPSPVRRLFQPALASSNSRAHASPSPDIRSENAEFVSSTPGVAHAEGSRIRQDAFSPNYFETFFVEERVLGKGGKGVVLLVNHVIDGCQLGQFACKRVPVGNDHAWLEKVLIEVELLAKLSHPNLVSYRHVWLEDVRLARFGPSVACAFILQQYCNGGDLHQYVVGGPPREATKEELKAQMRRRSKGQLDNPVDLFSGNRLLSFDEIYSLFKDITSGVAYLHAANYIHRDLKPSNCLLHRDGNKFICLISDFGEVQPENVVRNSTGTTGTISYCAPEVLKTDLTGRFGNFTTKSDIFSLGMILYFMCFGRLPYRSANAIQEELEDIDELREEITHWQGFHDERRERPDLPSKLYQLLKRLLALNANERPSANEVLKVMRGESNFDSISREDLSATPPIGLHGGRVQSLDSPVPGSPLSAPRKHHGQKTADRFQELEPWSMSPQREASPVSHGRSVLQDPPPQPPLRHRSNQSIVVSRGLDSRRNSAIPSDDQDASGATESDRFSPPLLMAPPNNLASNFRNKMVTSLFHILAMSRRNFALLSYFGRLGLFLVKVMSLTRPCWPYMINPSVAVPLIAAAALDLGLPRLAVSSSRMQPRSQLVPASPRAWGLGTSLVLLVLHFSALWMASRRQVLCAAPPHEAWADW